MFFHENSFLREEAKLKKKIVKCNKIVKSWIFETFNIFN